MYLPLFGCLDTSESDMDWMRGLAARPVLHTRRPNDTGIVGVKGWVMGEVGWGCTFALFSDVHSSLDSETICGILCEEDGGKGSLRLRHVRHDAELKYLSHPSETYSPHT